MSGVGGAEPKTVQRIETLRYWGGLPVYRPSNGDADWFALVTFSDVLSAHYNAGEAISGAGGEVCL